MEQIKTDEERAATIAASLVWFNNDPRKLLDIDRSWYFNHVLEKWEVSKKELEIAKAKEMDLRKQCVLIGFDPDKIKGTEHVPLANGYKATAVKSINYNFIKNAEGKTDKKAIDRALSFMEADGPAGELIAERLVKWKPELSLTEYNQLPPTYKEVIDKVIVTSEGAPTLDIVAPKGKK